MSLPTDPGEFMEWVVGPMKVFFPFERVFAGYGEFVAGQITMSHWQASVHDLSYLQQLKVSFDVADGGSLRWWIENRQPFLIDPRNPAVLGARNPFSGSRSPAARVRVSMSMIHGQLVQGIPLRFAQLDDAFHRVSFALDSSIKHTNFKTVYAEHLG